MGQPQKARRELHVGAASVGCRLTVENGRKHVGFCALSGKRFWPKRWPGRELSLNGPRNISFALHERRVFRAARGFLCHHQGQKGGTPNMRNKAAAVWGVSTAGCSPHMACAGELGMKLIHPRLEHTR